MSTGGMVDAARDMTSRHRAGRHRGRDAAPAARRSTTARDFVPMNPKASCRFMKMTTPELLLRCPARGARRGGRARRRRRPCPRRGRADDRDRHPRGAASEPPLRRRRRRSAVTPLPATTAADCRDRPPTRWTRGRRRRRRLRGRRAVRRAGPRPDAAGAACSTSGRRGSTALGAGRDRRRGPATRRPARARRRHRRRPAPASCDAETLGRRWSQEGPLRGRRPARRRRAARPRRRRPRSAATREGGHHRRRVVHAGGDATGAEVARTLEAAVRARRGRVVLDARSRR